MSDLLNIGASGLRAYSRSLATVSDNIANAQTPGYARRTLELRDMPGIGTNPLLRPHVQPGGVESAGITRATDEWVQAEARVAAGEGERTRLRMAATSNVEAVLSDDQSRVTAGLTALFTAADRLTAEPNSQPLRRQFLDAAGDVAGGLRAVAGRLGDLSAATQQAALADVADVNDALTALGKVNLSLLGARPGSTQEASLLDERDRLIDRAAAQLDVTASFGNRGTVTLRSATGGETLVGPGTVPTVGLTAAPNGQIAVTLGGVPLPVSSGRLAGHVEASAHIADQRAAIDTLATSIVGQLNAAHQAGVDAAGAPGQPLFAVTGGAATLAASPLSPDRVAAANSAANNGNMLSFANLRGAGGPETLWADHRAQQSQLGASAQAQHGAAVFRADAAAEARDSMQVVDLDREAADLIRFQQAYAAAAQTIQVARETLQALFNAI
jgi:flagellar hook-associated protein 1